ncbi:hypothetical protein ACM26M_03795 [Kluyvera cryocrescens]|uniref:hypothetical protein n=1 Tax=Kluyvera cryocrescens TaxID=580 RepID=UPI0039F69781
MMTIKMAQQIFIAGGYGMIGGNLATQLRARFPESTLILAGRTPQKGEALAAKLGNALTVSLDLLSGEIPQLAATSQLIISAVPDPKHALGEFAIRHNIAFIDITVGTADGYAPLLNMAMQYQATSPVVPLGYYEAGMFLPLVDKLSRQFSSIDSVRLTALHDPEDPIGAVTEQELTQELAPAFVREEGIWRYTSAQDEIDLISGERVETTPFGILDVSAVAAMTNAENIRLDVAMGISEGQRKSAKASVELYVDMQGINDSGIPEAKRIIASDPQGQAHFTALGVITMIEAMFESSFTGFVLPEQLLKPEVALAAMQQAGVELIEA